MVPMNYYIVLAFILFFIGLMGFILRRNLIVMLVSIEVMLNGIIILFAAISHYVKDVSGYIIIFFVIASAAAESAVGLTLAVLIYKKLKTVYSTDINNFNG
ncbi:MAG: NADH-quinone oxidoreductase subunit NuoK [Thermodesulfobacteria bacterium]|nr:NADH-quinone oxidoreductase subunit NuoK [Thermodesulfobacteriota bacterium]